MGSGKSAVGKRLATVLKIPFLDLDAEIEKDTKQTIAEIFEAKGEIFFRKKEAEILQLLLRQKNSFVLATGGGTPCYGNTMELLKNDPNVLSVYLQSSLETLTNRLSKELATRPLIAHLKTTDALNDFIRKHLFERTFYYEQATIKIDANTSIEEVISQIVMRLF